MNAPFYIRYTLRSLVRGGTRTVLAVFCIGVGVMAIIALQLAGLTIGRSFTDDIRAINHGDISMDASTAPLSGPDLTYFDGLRSSGDVTQWTATVSPAYTSALLNGQRRPVNISGIDPAVYPLAGRVRVESPSGANFQQLVSTRGNAVIGPVARDLLGAKLGDHVRLSSQTSSFEVTVAGILPATGFESAFNMFVSLETLQAGSTDPLRFSAVYLNTPDHARMVSLATSLRQRFPTAIVGTTDDILKQREDASSSIRQFLKIAGLLALLVGGIGVVNTMQVLLSRNRVEIAMLKTAGYRRRDLYVLFGLEAAWLGLAGGALGAVLGVGLSYGAIKLVEGILLQDLTLIQDPGTVLSGVAIGLATAFIFGLLPIVRAAGIRPLAVLRELPEHGWRARLQTAGLLIVLAVLFTAFASVILQDLRFAAIAVTGTLIVLAILSALFALIAWGVSKLPVPERFSIRFIIFAALAIAAAAAVTIALPSVGIVLLIFAVLATGVVILPRTWKSTAKLAYRGIGRQSGRTAATLVALFVGVFTVGLMLILGQDIRARFNDLVAQSLTFNLAVIDTADRAHLVDQAIPTIPGLHGQRFNTLANVVPVALNGESVATVAARIRQQGDQGGGGFNSFSQFAQIEGSDLGGGEVPHITVPKKPNAGRALTALDAGTNNVLLQDQLLNKPWNLKAGDTITVSDQAGKATQTITVVGFFGNNIGDEIHNAAVLGDDKLVRGLGGSRTYGSWLLKVDPSHTSDAFRIVSDADAQATMVDFTDFVSFFDRLLSNVIVFLSAIASLALLAGIVIIANTVALAMLERRREIGILKSVGYDSGTVLSQVLLENAVVGALGGIAAITAVAVATTLLGRLVFKSDLPVSTPLALGIIIATSLLAAGTAALVAWKPVRVRPLEVLRYE